MIRLDKTKRLPHYTYFYLPEMAVSQLDQLMANSHEEDYFTRGCDEVRDLDPEDQLHEIKGFYPNAPEQVTRNPAFCVSHYDPEYLHEMLVKLMNDPERVAKHKAFMNIVTSHPNFDWDGES